MNVCVHTYTKSQTPSTRRRGPGWRIHGSVEDTKLSTNKQHSLSSSDRTKKAPLCCPCDSCLVRSTDLKGSEAGKRESVVMASSGQVPRVPGRGGKRQAGRRGDGRRRRCRIGRRGRQGRRSRIRNARMATQESMRGLQGRQHLRAQANQGSVQGLRGRLHLRAQPTEEHVLLE